VAPAEGYVGKPRTLSLAALIRRSIGWSTYESYNLPDQYMPPASWWFWAQCPAASSKPMRRSVNN